MNSSNRRGVSIAETLIGIFLLALLLTAFFNLFPTTVLANRKGTQQLQANNLARSTLAEIRNRPFEELTIGLSETLQVTKVESNEYEVSYLVSAPNSGQPENLKVVDIKVQWMSNNRKNEITEKAWIHRVIED